MKKVILLLLGLILLGPPLFPQQLYRQYATQKYMKDLLAGNPGLEKARSAIERHTYDFGIYGRPDTVTIPVVIHLVGAASAAITWEDVQAQLNVLNKDFYQPEYLSTESAHEAWKAEHFAGKASKPFIRFCLAAQNPSGKMTPGVVYALSKVASFPVSNAITTSKGGGSPAWNTANYLNIWVAPLENDVAGFAQMPGGPVASDGIVIHTRFFARTNQRNYITTDPAIANYAFGRTLSHLVGSYLGLYELWNDDQPCADDYVHDTPIHNAPNYEKPGYRHVSTCGDNPVEMTMNLMDNTDDEAQYMFTNGQMMRMYATLAPKGGPRAGLRTLASPCSNGGLFAGDVTGERSSDASSEVPAGKLAVQVYPNPASGGFTVLVSSLCEEEIRLTSFNQLGVQQHSQTVDGAQAGQTNAVYINARDWAPGMYLVRVHCGKETASAKILLER